MIVLVPDHCLSFDFYVSPSDIIEVFNFMSTVDI